MACYISPSRRFPRNKRYNPFSFLSTTRLICTQLLEAIPSNLESLHCIVTGANSGIGYATAETLAKSSCHLYLVCRHKERGEAAIAKLKQVSGNQHIYLYLCDMSCMSQVKKLANQLIEDKRPVNALIHNAGCMIHQYQLTKEGFETNFATNLLSVFYLTELLIPVLHANGPSRVGFGLVFGFPLVTCLSIKIGYCS